MVTYLCDEGGTYIELPILNYAGYRAYDESGQKLQIVEGEQQRLRIMLDGDGIEHTIYVRFGPVAGFVIADVISALTLAGVVYLYWTNRQKKIQNGPSGFSETK